MVIVIAKPTPSISVNLSHLFSAPSKKEMPFIESVKHDFNNLANEGISYSALYFLINSFGLEKYIFQPTDTAFLDALKSAGIVVTMNEALRLAKRMGWSVQILK